MTREFELITGISELLTCNWYFVFYFSPINPINNKDNKCFQYVVTVAINHEKNEKNSKRITKIKRFINKYNLDEINFTSEKDDWEKNYKMQNFLLFLNSSNYEK